MPRTKSRPIPSKKISPDRVLYFSISLLLVSLFLMWLYVNALSAFILFLSMIFYVVIYTIWLKRSSPINIVIGGAAGSFPPIIGWTSVTNSLHLEPAILFLIIFLWTPPHFWALSILKKKDYEAASIPMMPNVYGDAKTQLHIFIYTIALSLTTFVPYLMGFSGILYISTALILDIVFLYLTYPFAAERVNNMKVFKYSILYLFALFSIVLIDKV